MTPTQSKLKTQKFDALFVQGDESGLVERHFRRGHQIRDPQQTQQESCAGERGHLALVDLVLDHAVVDVGVEDLHDGVRIHPVDMSVLAVTDFGQTFHADLTQRFAHRQQLGKAGHIQNIKHFRGNIFHHQLTAQLFLCLQQYPQTGRRDIGQICCVDHQRGAGDGAEQLFLKFRCVGRADAAAPSS